MFRLISAAMLFTSVISHADDQRIIKYLAVHEAASPVIKALEASLAAQNFAPREEAMLLDLFNEIVPLKLEEVDNYYKREVSQIDRIIRHLKKAPPAFRGAARNYESLYRDDHRELYRLNELTQLLALKERIQRLLLRSYKISGQIYENRFASHRDGKLSSMTKEGSNELDPMNPASKRLILSHFLGTPLLFLIEPSFVIASPAVSAVSVQLPRYYGALRARFSKGGRIYPARKQLTKHLAFVVEELMAATKDHHQEWVGKSLSSCQRLLSPKGRD